MTFFPEAAARWSIKAVSGGGGGSPRQTIEHGSIETIEINMIVICHMTHHDSV